MEKDTSSPTTVIKGLHLGWQLATRHERRQGILLSLGHLIGRTVDMLAVMSVLPFVTLVMEPNSDTSQKIIAQVTRLIPETLLPYAVGILGIMVLLLVASSMVVTLWLQWVTSRYGARCQTRITQEVCKSVIEAPISWLLTQNSAFLVRVMNNDLAVWSRVFAESVVAMIAEAATVFLALVIVVRQVSPSGLAALLAFVLVALAVFRFAKPRISAHARIQRKMMNAFTMTMTQVINGARDIKVANTEAVFLKECDGAIRDAARSRAANAIWRTVSPTVLLFVCQAGLIVAALMLWWVGTDSVEATSQLALLVLLTLRVAPALSRLGSMSTRFWEALPHFAAIHDLRNRIDGARRAVRRTPASTVAIPNDWREIRLEDVSFNYPNVEMPSIDGISLTLSRNRTHCVVGPSGAGKSTLVDLILGLHEPRSGRILLDDTDLGNLDHDTWCRRIGYVPQTPFILDDTLRANIALGVPPREVDEDCLRSCLEAVHLDGFVDRLADGVDSAAGERGYLISGGQRQRLALARALYRRPEILILDEATNAVDAATQRAIWEGIQAFRDSITFIIISHDVSGQQEADWFFLLEDGRLTSEGTFGDLFERSATFRLLTEEAATGDSASLIPASLLERP